MSDSETIVVVGGGLAGVRTCEALRAEGFDGAVVLLCAEQVRPYDRPPLSKTVLREGGETTLDVDYAALDIDVRLGIRAEALDLRARTVLTDGGQIAYSTLVIATGATPVILPGTGRQSVMRTAEDAAALRDRLLPGAHVALVGAGWINAEIATTALGLGCTVTCVEAGHLPLARQLGGEVAGRMLDWWEGVDLRVGTGVTRVTDSGLELEDGSTIEADVVVTGIGVRPDVGWLADSGLDIERGVVVDASLRTSDPHVYAVGDVAARWSPRVGARVGCEHWDDARTGPAVAARAILAGESAPASRPVFDPVPYFWSDQFGHKVQFVGHRGATDRVILREGADGKWGAAWINDGGRLTAHVSIDSPRHMVQARMAIDRGAVVDVDAVRDLAAPLHSPTAAAR